MKKYSILMAVLFFFTGAALAQQSRGDEPDSSHTPTNDSLLAPWETMPEYPGGTGAMQKFIAKNIKYPPLAIDNNITGKVVVEFVIDENGDVTNAKVIKGIGWGCDEEALRVINLMPRWKPGTQKGENVSVRFVVPIRFNLENSRPKRKRKRGN